MNCKEFKENVKRGQTWELDLSTLFNDKAIFRLYIDDADDDYVCCLVLKSSKPSFYKEGEKVKYGKIYLNGRNIFWTLLYDPSSEEIMIGNKYSGMICLKCRLINQYAEPNCSNGKYICYNCR